MCNIVVRFGGVSEVGQDDTRISLSHVSESYEYCTKTLVVLVYAHESVFVVSVLSPRRDFFLMKL